MNTWTLVVLLTSVVGTSFLSGILGMAGGMILMGILLALVPVGAAMVLHGITQFASNGWRAWLWRASIDWRVVRGYALGGALALAVFGAVQLVLSRPLVLVALGVTPFLIYLLPRGMELNVDRRGHATACGLSCMSIQLLSGVSGPLLDSFFLKSGLDRKAVVATKAAAQTLSHLAKIAYFASLTTTDGGAIELPTVLGLVITAMLGTSASRRVLERMSDGDFRSWTRRAVFTVGGIYLTTGLWSIGH